MANKSIFSTQRGPVHRQYGESVKTVDTVNEAGGEAYSFTAKSALAQLASTGCFGNTFYVNAKSQLDKVQELLPQVDSEFLAKLAVYARQKGYMKDMPALMLAYLFAHAKDSATVGAYFKAAFPEVMDNGRMLRNFVQIIRSGVTGRKSFGTAGKRVIQDWLTNRSYWKLFGEAVGNDPSMCDVLKMTRPHPKDDEQRALFGYITDAKEGWDREALPDFVKEFEAFKQDQTKPVPNVSFERLSALPLGKEHWIEIAKKATWFQTLKSLNTYKRHGALEHSDVVDIVAERLADLELVKKAKVFPYQIFVAYKAANDLPRKITNALQDALEHALRNIPFYEGQVYIFPDVSGSMLWGNLTGHSQSSIRCIDVAALITAAIMKTNYLAEVLPFDTRVHDAKSLNHRDSVVRNAEILSRFGGGGTYCELPLRELNDRNAKGDLLIYVSDNESWVGAGYRSHTGLLNEWAKFKQRNRQAKMVCIDLQANTSTQATDTPDILNVGGFSDQVFNVIDAFLKGGSDKEHWVKEIEKVYLG